MSRLKLTLWLPALLVACLALAPTAVRAQDPVPPRPPGNATLGGEVTDVNPLTVKVDGQDRLLQTAPNVLVVRDGKEVKLGDLEKGDKVVFTTNPDNSVQRLDVTETAGPDLTRWLLIGLLVLAALVVVGLVWYLSQRRDRGGYARRTDPGAPLSSNR